MTEKYQHHLRFIKTKLDNISPSFCAAKWKQVTIHLQNGHTHSCHHPDTHLIPLEEITVNPTALHNTEFKKQQRKMMLEGARPSECDYCWKIEDETTDNYSDRVYKSATATAFPYIDDIVKKSWNDDVDPSYVEVNFSNVCNFKCSYCAPHISSQWMEEIERYGPYPTSGKFNNLEWLRDQKKMPIPNRDENPYVDAFWKWWPEMYNSLEHFRITGGEPLLSKNTFKVLDYIIENPNPKLEFSINTNMNPPDDIFDAFLDKIKIIVTEKKIKKFRLFTSAEAHGEQSNYIRFGMDYDKWLNNIHRVYQEIPDIQFTIMSTYNIMSLPSYTKFLNDILEIKRKYRYVGMKDSPMMIDIPYLRFPEHQAIFIMDPKHLHWVKEHMDFMFANLESPSRPYDGFFKFEADKMRRIYEMGANAVANKTEFVNTNRIDFVKFVDEHDQRRGTNFLETFPELEDFYNNCKKLIA